VIGDATARVIEAIKTFGQRPFLIQEVVEASGQKENIVLHVVKTLLEDSEVRYPETAPPNEKRRYTYTPAFRHWEMMTRDWRDISGISDQLSGPGSQAQQLAQEAGEGDQTEQGVTRGHRDSYPAVPYGGRPDHQGRGFCGGAAPQPGQGD